MTVLAHIRKHILTLSIPDPFLRLQPTSGNKSSYRIVVCICTFKHGFNAYVMTQMHLEPKCIWVHLNAFRFWPKLKCIWNSNAFGTWMHLSAAKCIQVLARTKMHLQFRLVLPLPTHAYCRVLRSRMIDEYIELQNEPRLALQVHLLAEIWHILQLQRREADA